MPQMTKVDCSRQQESVVGRKCNWTVYANWTARDKMIFILHAKNSRVFSYSNEDMI